MILDHPSQNLEIIYVPAMLQWPEDSCYVVNMLFVQYELNFCPKNTNLVYFWPGKKSFQNAKKFLSSLLGVKTVLFLPLVDGVVAAVDYLNRKWCSGSFFQSKMADFVFPVTLSSATFTDSYSVTPGLFLLALKPKPTNQMLTKKCWLNNRNKKMSVCHLTLIIT